MNVKAICNLHTVRKNLFNCFRVCRSTVTGYSCYMSVVLKPFFQSLAIAAVQYGNRAVRCFINNNGPISVSLFKSKIIDPYNSSTCFPGCFKYRFINRRITVSPLTLIFTEFKILAHASQLVSRASRQMKSSNRSVIRLL